MVKQFTKYRITKIQGQTKKKNKEQIKTENEIKKFQNSGNSREN